MANNAKSEKPGTDLPEWMEEWLFEETTKEEVEAALREDGEDPAQVARAARDRALRILGAPQPGPEEGERALDVSNIHEHRRSVAEFAPDLGLAASVDEPLEVTSGITLIGPVQLAGRTYDLLVVGETGEVVLCGAFDAHWTTIVVGDDRYELRRMDADNMRLCQDLGRARLETASEDKIVVKFE